MGRAHDERAQDDTEEVGTMIVIRGTMLLGIGFIIGVALYIIGGVT